MIINPIFFSFFGTHEALDHLASSPSSKETISWPGIELPITKFGLGTSSLSFNNLGHLIQYVHRPT